MRDNSSLLTGSRIVLMWDLSAFEVAEAGLCNVCLGLAAMQCYRDVSHKAGG